MLFSYLVLSVLAFYRNNENTSLKETKKNLQNEMKLFSFYLVYSSSQRYNY